MTKTRIAFMLILAGVMLVSFAGSGFAQEFFVKDGAKTMGKTKYAPAEIIVKFKAGVSDEVASKTNKKHNASVLSVSTRGKFKRLRIPKNKSIEEMVAIYSQNPNVEYAEPNFIATAHMVPNDPYYAYQWHMDNSVYGGINMESAWDVQTGDESVVVAVIDTGVAYENYTRKFKQAPDLANTSFVQGYDFVNNDNHPNDDEGHGTHVAGTIAQSTNNNLGTAGVAFNATIMPIKVLNSKGRGYNSDIADGIYFAADNGADIINLSLGGPDPSITLENALAYAYGKGVIIVCSAGNEYLEGNQPSYPAAYDAYCIAVAATRFDEARAPYSNTGSYLDIAAPGGDLGVDQNEDGYADGVLQQTFGNNPRDFGYWFYSGTSMAAPHVAGVCALLIANGTTDPNLVREAIENTAKDKDPVGWDPGYGHGIIDAYAALNYTSNPVHDIAVTNISAPSQTIQGETVSVVATVANQGDFDESFTVTLTDTTTSSVIGSKQQFLISNDTQDVTFNWDTADYSVGEHMLEAVAGPVAGEEDTADNGITTTISLQEPSHDVAVIAMDTPQEAYQGDSVSVTVTVENQGTYFETTTVSLTDTTDNILIGSQSVSISAGDPVTVTFTWDTASASIGGHALVADASQVPGENDITDNSINATTAILETQPEKIMYVSDITVELKKMGPNRQARASVAVIDSDGAAVGEATVTGDWRLNTAYLNTSTNTTNSEGHVRLDSNKTRANSGDTFKIEITNVSKTGYTYDPSRNTETTETIVVP